MRFPPPAVGPPFPHGGFGTTSIAAEGISSAEGNEYQKGKTTNTSRSQTVWLMMLRTGERKVR